MFYLLWNSKGQYLVYNSPPNLPIMSQINPPQTQTHFCNVISSIIFTPTPRFSESPIFFGIFNQNLLQFELQLIHSDLITLIICIWRWKKLWSSSSLNTLQPSATSYFLIQIFFSAPCLICP